MTTKQYKPFDLEAAKAGAPIVCRSGHKARFVGHVSELYDQKVIVILDGCDYVTYYYDNGRYALSHVSGHDLLMAPTKRTVYVNLYSPQTTHGDGMEAVATVYDDKDTAIRLSNSGHIAVAVPIEIEV